MIYLSFIIVTNNNISLVYFDFLLMLLLSKKRDWFYLFLKTIQTRENWNVTHFFQASFINRVWSNKLCFCYQLFHAEIRYQSFWIIVCVLKRTIHKISHNDVKNDLPIIEFVNFCQLVQIMYFDLTFCWPGDWNPKLNWPLTHWSQKPNWWYILSGLKISPSFCEKINSLFFIVI